MILWTFSEATGRVQSTIYCHVTCTDIIAVASVASVSPSSGESTCLYFGQPALCQWPQAFAPTPAPLSWPRPRSVTAVCWTPHPLWPQEFFWNPGKELSWDCRPGVITGVLLHEVKAYLRATLTARRRLSRAPPWWHMKGWRHQQALFWLAGATTKASYLNIGHEHSDPALAKIIFPRYVS